LRLSPSFGGWSEIPVFKNLIARTRFAVFVHF